MPIILFESGSVMFLKEECFKIGQEEAVEEEEFIPAAVPELSATSPQATAITAVNNTVRRDSDASFLSGVLSVNSSFSAASIDPSSRKKVMARSKKLQKEKPKDLYRINLVFDKFTTFLMIPYSQVERILGNENLIMKSMAEGEH